MSLKENLTKLSDVCGVTGRESNVREILSEMLKPYVDEIHIDRMENLIAVKKGKPDAPKIMLAAHMDEIGLMVKTITKNGFLQFSKLGGIDDRILLAQKVAVYTQKGVYAGVVGAKPPHIQKEDERKKIVTCDELFVDIGTSSKEDAINAGVSVGDPIGFDVKCTELCNQNMLGKAFDNRAGCAALVETMKLKKDSDCSIYAVGTVQEEVGLRGAGPAAYGINPDLALALDVTTAGDVPGVREYDTSVKLGNGPALTVYDSGTITHPKILRWIRDTASEENIPMQFESGLSGGTDAGRISLTRQGVPSGTISIPTRYIHSPACVLNLNDVENTAKLVAAAIGRATQFF